MPGPGDRIRKRKDGRFEARHTVQTPTGPQRKTLYGRTYGEVEKKLNEARANADQGLMYDNTTKLADYLAAWLADSVRDTVRQKTFEGYKHTVDRHIAPMPIGKMKIKDINPAHVRALYRAKLDSGLSARTVQYIHVTLNKAMKQAAADGMIPRNPAASVKAPRPAKREIAPLTADGVRTLLDTVRGDRLEALYVAAITAGLRQGELLGLRWADVDLDAGWLQVRRTLSQTRTGHIYEPPKSGKGRHVRLSRRAVNALRAHRKAQLEERMKLAGLWEDNDLVFASEVGTPIGARNLQRGFKIRLGRAGLPDMRFHDLRHTCATLLLKQGVHPKYVQELLGHGDIALTLNVYSHVLPDMGDAAAGAMDEALQ